jgi:hypothetical protein
MPYTVKLKNQIGTEVFYQSIEQVSIPLSSGAGNATFLAKYTASMTGKNSTFTGGATAAYGVDYICHINTLPASKYVPTSVTVKIAGNTAIAGTDYEYTKNGSVYGLIKIFGASITGNIEITANASDSMPTT